MTDDQADKIALEDVRTRFVETEQRLKDAASAIDDVRSSAEAIGTTRETLVSTSDRLATLSGSLSDLASGLAENADQLRQGVDAIRMGDPAEVRRQIEELGEAVSASQAVNAERLEAVASELKSSDDAARVSVEVAISRNRLEARVGFLLVAILAAAAVVVPFVVTTV